MVSRSVVGPAACMQGLAGTPEAAGEIFSAP